MKLEEGKYQLVDKISDLFLTGNPEFDKRNPFVFLDNIEKVEKNIFVYLINFNDETVKIGVSAKPKDRIKIIQKQSGRTAKDYFISNLMPKIEGFKLESKFKDHYKSSVINGEFYKQDYSNALNFLKSNITN